MAEYFIEFLNGTSTDTLYYNTDINNNFVYSAGLLATHPNYTGQSLGPRTLLTIVEANQLRVDDPLGNPFNGTHEPIYVTYTVINHKVDVYFYPDLNVSDVIVDQKVDVYFYPDSNVTDSVINQEVKIEFYPDGNVADETTVLQEVKIEFYPDGNVSDVIDPVVVDGFKFWFGMSGKKRYGKGLSKRISF
tara:strand:+ start:472 stop:1041 length:570 start_codon:yes stop_codon:yes gene_type:complete